MSIKLLKALFTISLFCAVLPANANLIINGGFEDTTVGNGKWAWFNANDVNGWEGSNIEIWNNYPIFSAVEGANLAELNAHPSNGNAFSIFQTFDTTVGSIYDLSFFYGARASSNEAFQVTLYASDSTEVLSQLIDDHEVKRWSFYSNSFKAISESTTLMFTSVFPEFATVGNFLDDIKVITSPTNNLKVTDVPEPSSWLLAGLGLLIMFRHKFKSKFNN